MSDWKPRKQAGGVYCSPACGSKCKRRDYDRAHADARAAAKTMSAGWTPRVWENMGWHWNIEKGVCSIHPSHFEERYTAYFNSTWQVLGYGSSPNEALGKAIREVRRRVRALEDDIRRVIN